MSSVDGAAAAGNPCPEMTLEFHMRHLLFLLVEKLCNDREASKEVPAVPVNMLSEAWAEVYGKDLGRLLAQCGYTELEPALEKVEGLYVAGSDTPTSIVMLAPPSLKACGEKLKCEGASSSSHRGSPTASTDDGSRQTSFADICTEGEEASTDAEQNAAARSLVVEIAPPAAKSGRKSKKAKKAAAKQAQEAASAPLAASGTVMTGIIAKQAASKGMKPPAAACVGNSRVVANPLPVAMMQELNGTWQMVLVA
eukprot:CAMPEP_0178421296 /NCGR_PEP_ID=MMETSP0689_2-20121128/26574_1 /TAXON_ID=160604 /ORGANISM="Amphidinium massartii, Strain CS-259" /LENGTH=252 /DNA_ID=CAMNT_0020042803 /DNA_START=107 /DNA_END=865 /DNA_ORIENTATION=+